jgi:hypothetical protein
MKHALAKVAGGICIPGKPKEDAMTKNTVSNKHSRSVFAHAAVTIMVGATLSWAFLMAGAEERLEANESAQAQAPHATSAELEKAFWICDHAATTRTIDTSMGIACSVITEELKVKHFNGDFEAMLAWWQENKPARHQALAATSAAR